VLENSAFVGAVIPGDVVLLLAGFYAERGALELAPISLLYLSGALIGDSVGYLIGRLAGRRIVDRWGARVWLHRDRIESFDRYFQEYGIWAVAIGRLTPVVRTVNTFAAGMSKMPYWAFILAAGAAAAVWSVALPVLGFLLSGSLDAVRSALGWVGVALLILFVFFLFWTYRRMMRRLEKQALHRAEHRTEH
jgi:membrane-associated protein